MKRHRPEFVTRTRCLRGQITVLATAFILLATGWPGLVRADEPEKQLSPETVFLYGRVNRAITDLDGYLRAIGFEKPAVLGTNYFSMSIGGVDAIRDLEESRGVDPETLAALYAGYATPEVAKHLNLRKIADERGQLVLKIEAADGRLRYKNAVVRMYSPERLRELFALRQDFRVEPARQRRQIFSDFVYTRQREAGNLKSDSARSEIEELSDKYRELQPLLQELDAALRTDVGATSILSGGASQHFFGYSLGGIDVVSDLNNGGSVDPETFAAIHAGYVSADYADSFNQDPSNLSITYSEMPVTMYSVPRLEATYKLRERMQLLSQR